MQAAQNTNIAPATTARPVATGTAMPASAASAVYAGYQIIRRNGAVVVLRAERRSAVALMKAFLAVHGTQGAASAQRARDGRERLTERRGACAAARRPGGGTFHIEDVQDHVELALMRSRPP